MFSRPGITVRLVAFVFAGARWCHVRSLFAEGAKQLAGTIERYDPSLSKNKTARTANKKVGLFR